MLRLIIAAVGITAAIIAAPTAAAQPKFCDGSGHYITACAVGGGGGGPSIWYKDKSGKFTSIKESDVYKHHA